VLSSYYYSKDICTASDATPTYATIATAGTSCVSLGVNSWGKAACNSAGGVDVSVYTNKDCTGTPSVSKNDASTCATTQGSGIQSQTCVTGTFKAPMPIASSSTYTDDKCTTPSASGYVASFVTVYPLDKCAQVDASTSQIYKCVSGSPTLIGYKGLKCTGETAGTVTFPAGKCVTAGSGMYMKWDSCASSGAASTSVTFLAFGLLVLATFSSAM
jgi:hypothetical protein